MQDWFLNPWWLWLIVPLVAVQFAWYRKRDPRLRDARLRLQMFFGGLSMLALVLALSGLRWPGAGQKIRVVAAVDLSASIFDRAVQAKGYQDAVRTLAEHPDVEMGLVVFGRQAGLEQALRRMPNLPLDPSKAPDRFDQKPFRWPDFVRTKSELDRGASDFNAALSFCRGQFDPRVNGARAIILLTDGLDTGSRAGAAAALAGSGIDLLTWPAPLRVGSDVLMASIHVPETARMGRGLPIELSVEGPPEVEVMLRVLRLQGSETFSVGRQKVKLRTRDLFAAGRARTHVRMLDHPERPGVVVYEACVEESEAFQLSGDYSENNRLQAAVRVEGPAKWAVLTTRGSTLSEWARHVEPGTRAGTEGLGVALQCFHVGAFPTSEEAYRGFTGVLVDGLSAEALPEASAEAKALALAVRGAERASSASGGMGLVALGGERAFGSGAHPEGGLWESLLPVTFRPDDDRTRTVLFMVDVSQTMALKMGEEGKLDFARNQLGLAVQDLRPSDRVGLIAFSASAEVVYPIATAPEHASFVKALSALQIKSNTNFLAAFEKAKELLSGDDAKEQLVILLSDGVQSPVSPEEALRKAVVDLCPAPADKKAPRRAALYAFGIGTSPEDTNEAGERQMKLFAEWGGGAYFPEFQQLARRLRNVFNEDRKGLYSRHDPFCVVRAQVHPVLSACGESWPILPFRNRIKPRGPSEVLLLSAPLSDDRNVAAGRKPDPLLVLGHLGASRTVALSLSLDGDAGQAFLSPGKDWKGGRPLLAALLSWAEGRWSEQDEQMTVRVEQDIEGELRVVARVRDPKRREPSNGLNLSVRLAGLLPSVPESVYSGSFEPLFQCAPGSYRATLSVPKQGAGVYRLEVRRDDLMVAERFVSVSYAAEYRRFGTDRAMLAGLARMAGGDSRLINLPQRDMQAWLQMKKKSIEYKSAGSFLLVLAILLILLGVAARGMRFRKTIKVGT